MSVDVPQAETASTQSLMPEEVGLATRNHGFYLEGLRYDVTPVGMHYLLTHYDVPHVAAHEWQLTIDGCVDNPLTLSLDDVRSRPSITQRVTMECAGNGRMGLSPRPLSQPWGVEAVGNGEWTGISLAALLDEAGLDRSAKEIVFTGLDSGIENGVEQTYARSLSLAEAYREDVALAYELNGQPLPPQHGFPLRLLVPGWYGMGNVKWLTSIKVIDHEFTGYQQFPAYHIRMEAGERGTPVSRIRPRALMIPPGVPEFFSRDRTMDAEPTTLQGRAWSGSALIRRVEVSTDDGMTWSDAELEPQTDRYGWVGWSYRWEEPRPGRHALSCRAVDAKGNTQPLEPEWNLGGYQCNSVQWVIVDVRP